MNQEQETEHKKQAFCSPLNLPLITDISVIKAELMKRLREVAPEFKDVTIISVEPLDWGTPQTPQVIEGWIEITYQSACDR